MKNKHIIWRNNSQLTTVPNSQSTRIQYSKPSIQNFPHALHPRPTPCIYSTIRVGVSPTEENASKQLIEMFDIMKILRFQTWSLWFRFSKRLLFNLFSLIPHQLRCPSLCQIHEFLTRKYPAEGKVGKITKEKGSRTHLPKTDREWLCEIHSSDSSQQRSHGKYRLGHSC